VPNNAPFGHCPKCLLELGFGPLPELSETSSPPAAAEGRRFGDYELLDQIGRGGMGIIYKARQATLNRLVALKMIRAAEFASPTLVQRFHLEAESAANLHHPNIVPIFETGEHEGEHFFSMALVDGFGLDRYITPAGFCFGRKAEENKPSRRERQEQSARLMAKVARAVDYAHQHGVLHRDLRPANILLDRQGEPHLTGFGVAKVVGQSGSNLTLTGAIIGTPSYMAREQAAGQSKRATTAADVYSLGAIFYEMLTGQPPFRAATPVETLKQVIEQEPKHPTTFKEGVDGDLATICMKCLEKEPGRRYRSAEALAEDLERWLQGRHILARPVSEAEKLWRWCRRNPTLAALSAAVVLLLAAVAVLSTVVAIHIAAKNKDIEMARKRDRDQSEVVKQMLHREREQSEVVRQMLFGVLDQLWTNSAIDSYTVESEKMRALAGKDTATPGLGPNLHLTFGTYFYKHPTNLLGTLSPALLALEDDLAKQLGRTVTIDLRIFNRYQPAIDAFASNELHFGRVGPSSYVQLLERHAPVSLLAVQDSTNAVTLAIFARKGSEVAKRYEADTSAPLAELLKNRSFAFGDAISTTGNFIPKWFLVRNGIHAADLGRQTNLIAHDAVLEAVAKGEFEVGAANLNLVVKNKAFVVLASYPLSEDVGRCWVATQALDPAIARKVQKWLLNLSDPYILRSLSSSEGDVIGFKTMDEKALAPLRKIMRDAAAFDTGKN